MNEHDKCNEEDWPIALVGGGSSNLNPGYESTETVIAPDWDI